MTVNIKSIGKSVGDKYLCQLEHQRNFLTCLIDVSASLRSNIPSEVLQVEFDFAEVLDAKIIANLPDSKTGIKQGDGLLIHQIFGHVHNVVHISEDSTIYDVYLRNGPEFLCVSSENWAIEPKVGDGIYIKTSGLCIYPSNI
ncbi:TPA: hypothetical protein JG855_004667 [Vibrio parahaemolyticus]|uniref:hypothetical protein n=1 Tax=Vibrio parahaemolyticus TaxID=670 RepID=UPI00112180B8|nr:hypothetical protein [Vibrio parahaemolyticus]EGQ9921362.1 hypothetical protein [Vibrio parahaemolyticus]MDF4359980.1 hypothetical protein [Vibrio parahaemolyticus]MDF4545711.1 hypothetical protein [Vibrio parahaemolyticus]MDG2580518.1 hypothetical protein [Vibrio parahaemolyticus]MDG2799814.1 hypothetical protein [Vibrio parahaemolyticus]